MITEDKMVEFVNTLEPKIKERNSNMDVLLQRSQHGEYLVIIQDATHTEKYIVNPATDQWVIFYG